MNIRLQSRKLLQRQLVWQQRPVGRSSGPGTRASVYREELRSCEGPNVDLTQVADLQVVALERPGARAGQRGERFASGLSVWPREEF